MDRTVSLMPLLLCRPNQRLRRLQQRHEDAVAAARAVRSESAPGIRNELLQLDETDLSTASAWDGGSVAGMPPLPPLLSGWT